MAISHRKTLEFYVKIRRETLRNLLEIDNSVPEVIWERFGRRKNTYGKMTSFYTEETSMYLKVLGFTAWLPRLEGDMWREYR